MMITPGCPRPRLSPRNTPGVSPDDMPTCSSEILSWPASSRGLYWRAATGSFFKKRQRNQRIPPLTGSNKLKQKLNLVTDNFTSVRCPLAPISEDKSGAGARIPLPSPRCLLRPISGPKCSFPGQREKSELAKLVFIWKKTHFLVAVGNGMGSGVASSHSRSLPPGGRAVRVVGLKSTPGQEQRRIAVGNNFHSIRV